MQCEMCGKTMDFLKKRLVEGVKMSVCPGCTKYGEPVPIKPVTFQKRANTPTQNRAIVSRVFNVPELTNEETIVDNYSELIRNARTKKQMSQTALAVKLAEKESVIHAIETGRHEPRMSLAKKLQKLLEIKLIEKRQADDTAKEMIANFAKKNRNNMRNDKMTLGDMITIKRRK